MAKRLLIIGTGSQARYVIDIAAQRRLKLVGMADIESAKHIGRTVNGVRVVCTADEITRRYKPSDCSLIIGYGDARRKREIAKRLSARGFRFVSVVSPHAVVSPSATIGEGCI